MSDKKFVTYYKSESFGSKVLIKGAAWNPYLKYPRNKQCYCNSGKKYKKCCISTEPLAVPKEIAEAAKSLIERIK